MKHWSTCTNILTRLPLRVRLARWLVSRLVRHVFRVRVRGLENIPKGNYIVLANHLSWIDPFLLCITLPAEPRLYFIAAEQAINHRWKEWAIKLLDSAIPFERGARWIGKDVFAKPLNVLRNGAVLAFFPEGDSGLREGELMPLKRGIGHFVLQADYPILPIALCGVKQLYWQKEITVTIGKPFRVNVQGLDRREAIGAAVGQVTSQLRAILPAWREPTVGVKRLRSLTNLLG